MTRRQLYQWVKGVSKKWRGVSRHFTANVVVFSRGVVAAQSSQIRAIAGCVNGKPDSQRRRLQRFVAQKRNLQGFFREWTKTVVGALGLKTVVLAVDETKLKNKLGVMVVGVVYEGRCIPLAWQVYRANSAADYPAPGQARLIIGLLNAVRAGVPKGMPVRVLADRGIGTSPLLMRGIMAMGWTFLFRVTRMSKLVLPDGQAVTFHDQVTAPGQTYAASGLVFKKRGRIPAHVRVVWGTSAKAPWALVTNDPALSGWEYAHRMWQEEAFRDFKSHGWHLENAALDCPSRIALLFVLLTVAYAWMLLWGRVRELALLVPAPKKRKNGSLVRRYSLFNLGRLAFLSALPFP
jgi:hypothetical protein